ncbi:helix-turn-helix domain-containing protein [Streptomyces variabilis]
MRVHRNRHDRAFVVVPNQAARHKKLSLVARGLLVTLLSMPDEAKATVETITDDVEEGRQTVSKAFRQLEAAGYLRRERFQNPETGLWCTETHVSDLPTDRTPAVGEPGARSVGDSPKGAKNLGKNLLPDPSAEGDGAERREAGEEEGEAPSDKNGQADPTDVETGRAARTLAHLGDTDRRLKLSTTEVLRLAPLAAAWLAEGHSALKITDALTARLPERIESAAALISYRLKNQMPAKPQPKPKPVPDTRDRCEVCRAPFPFGRRGTVCRACRDELDRAAAHLGAGSQPPAPQADETADPNSRGRALCRAAVLAAAA